MISKIIVQEWLELAQSDLNIAKEDAGKKERFGYVGFLCQQATEKFLKAYIIAFELEFLKTHDLETLLETCILKDPDFGRLRIPCRLLTPFYIETRYPDFVEISKLRGKNVKDALKYAEEIAKFVLKKLPA